MLQHWVFIWIFLEGQTSTPLKLLFAYFSTYKLAWYIKATNISAWILISLALKSKLFDVPKSDMDSTIQLTSDYMISW